MMLSHKYISVHIATTLSESIPVEPPATARALSGAPDGGHVEYPGEVQVAPFLHCNVSDRRPRRLHTGHPREDIRHAGQVQVSMTFTNRFTE